MSPKDLRRRAVFVAAAAAVVCLIAPSQALAHGIVGKTDLPLPRWLFAWSAAVVLIVSFVGLATLWPTVRLEHARSRVLTRLPRLLRPACAAIGLALFVLVVYAGFAGEQLLPTANITPTFIYVLFWVGFPFASLLGDVFRAFNPWLAAGLAIRWLARRLFGADRLPRMWRYPSWLGRWPAVPGVLGFAWLELIYVEKDNPKTLAIVSLTYAFGQLLGMFAFGIDDWEARGDAFSVYMNLYSRISPLRWRRERLEVHKPLTGLVALNPVPGTIALLAAMIGSTSFDGLQQGPLWMNTLEPEFQSIFSGLGLGTTPSVELGSTLGLLMMMALIGVVYRIGILGVHSVDRGTPQGVLAGRFIHTLVPIALAYVAAHYWSLLVYQTQASVALFSDPLGNGANIFGTAGVQINYNVLTPNSIWYFQVVVLLAGHVCGLALAHDRALVLYKDPRIAIRSQYWMLVVMVFLTCLGLWLLSAVG
jgi:hypothetical protein